MRATHPARVLAAAVALVAFLGGAAAPAEANRPLLSEALLNVQGPPGPPQGQIEGACGLAVSASNQLYVSDYYHRVVDRFTTAGGYVSQTALPGGPFTGLGANALDSVCGLGLDSGGALYANEWHQGVARLLPSGLALDSGDESTGVAVDPVSGRVYVDDRTYVAVYEPSGEPVEVEGASLRIGEGSLADAYGLAVDATGSRVYVADAASGSIEAFEPAVDAATPALTISHPFVSLVDAALAVDPTNGHLVVADNSQPGYEHPQAALEEFDPTGAYLGRLACGPVDGEPSGLAFDAAGNLYATNGNGEGSNVFKYGSYTGGSAPTPSCAAVAAAGGRSVSALLAPVAPSAAAAARAAGAPPGERLAKRRSSAADPSASASSTIQQRGIRVSFRAGIRPGRLPRRGAKAVQLALGVRIKAAGGRKLAQLRRVTVEFNRSGRIDPGALPACSVARIQPSTSRAALAACRSSLVGEGTFSADVRLPRQSPFPAQGKVLAFNGRYHGKPAILAHVFGAQPVPTSFTLPFAIGHHHGTYGSVLRASLPAVTGDAAAVTGLTLKLSNGHAKRRRPFVSAGCPTPQGIRSATFPLARARFEFSGGPRIAVGETASCRVSGG